jgi:DNA-binding MarR family transcriptional regulator
MSKRGVAGNLPQPGQGKRGEEGHIGYLLLQAAHAHRMRTEQALRDLDLTAPQFAAMTMLAAYPGHSNADLARLAFLTPQTMNVITANLQKAGLIRSKPHAAHGRIQQLELTASGSSLLARAKQRVYRLEEPLLDGLKAEEAQSLRRWLVAIAAGPRA